MAYIEREKARELIINFCKGAIEDGMKTLDPVDDIILLSSGVDLIPAADVAEVRHGKWIMRGGKFRCSECDGKALMQDVGGTGGFSHEFEQVKSDFCPHCGAKMDGKDYE